MRESILEENVAGKLCLTCYYDPELRDWDYIIAGALLKHKLKAGEVAILCLPLKGEVNDKNYR